MEGEIGKATEKCGMCGGWMREGLRFCSDCATQLDDGVHSGSPAPAPQPVIEAVPAKEFEFRPVRRGGNKLLYAIGGGAALLGGMVVVLALSASSSAPQVAAASPAPTPSVAPAATPTQVARATPAATPVAAKAKPQAKGSHSKVASSKKKRKRLASAN